MFSLAISFITAILFAIGLIEISKSCSNLNYFNDIDLSGPQKFHSNAVPRIGGICIVFGFLLGLISSKDFDGQMNSGFILFFCSMPTFLIGVCEDITKKISIKTRLLCTIFSAFLVIYFLQLRITSLDIPLIDPIIAFPIISILFTAFAITGLANSYNMIDGFHGLSSMTGIITLLGISYACFHLGEFALMQISLIITFSIMGFFIFNFPRGLLFLGDGGAYIIGFCIAVLSILITVINSEISPWFALLINGYPVTETIFSIYRRIFSKSHGYGIADGLHLHSIIYRRYLKKNLNREVNAQLMDYRNSSTSPILWIITILYVLPALLFMYNTPLLVGSLLICSLIYIRLYMSLIKYERPWWITIYLDFCYRFLNIPRK